MFILNKNKGGFEVYETNVQTLNSYARIVVDKTFLDKYNISVPTFIAKEDTRYKDIAEFFNAVNRVNEQEKVTNKRVRTDVPGSSKLVRSKDKQTIEIARRKTRKDGKVEEWATSNNTCYISNADRESFFYSVKYAGNQYIDDRGHWHFVLYYGDISFDYWARFMDMEYNRLCQKS